MLKYKSTKKMYSINIWNTFCEVFQILGNTIIIKYSNILFSEYFLLSIWNMYSNFFFLSILSKSEVRKSVICHGISSPILKLLWGL